MRPRFETEDLIFVDLWLQKKGERRGKEIRDMWRKETGDEGHRRHQQ